MHKIIVGNKYKQYLPWVILAAIILLLSAYMVYWGTQKEGFHIDEMFSVMSIRGGSLSRPYYYDEFFNTWHVAAELESTIGVSAENTFTDIGRFTNPYRNLLHIAYSLRPDEFTIWPSMILNLLTFACSLIVIYLLSQFFIDNKYLALLPCIAWGLSSAAVNLVLFIRFYTLKTFLCLLLTYVVFIAVKKGFGKWRYMIAVALVLGLGALTHQYFFVYAFFLIAFVYLYLLAMKQYKPLLKFSGIMIAAAAAYQIMTDGGISRLFTSEGGRAEETIGLLTQGNAGFFGRILAYFNIVSEALFGNISIYIVVIIIALMIFIVCITYTGSGAGIVTLLKKQKTILWLIMGGACLLYLLMIAIIAPYQELRYIFCVTPLIMILFVSLFTAALKAIGFKSTVAMVTIVSTFAILLPFGNIRRFNLHWGAEMSVEALKPYYHLPVVCINEEPYHVASCYPQLFDFEDKVLFATIGDADSDAIGEQSFDEGLILLLWYTSDESEIEFIMDAAGLGSVTYVTNLVRHEVYLLE